MGSDRARVSFDPSRQWRGVVAQQGRVSLEADWNEQVAIAAARDRLTTLDVVGPCASPDGGYVVTAVPATGGPSGSTPGDLTVSAGTLYLGGERLELDDPLTYSSQPDWLNASTDPLYVKPAVPEGSAEELVYLLAAEQEVSAVEDSALADVALGGPDTAQRLRILQHVVRTPSQGSSCTSAWSELESTWASEGYRLDAASMQLASTASLLVSFANEPTAPTPCQPVSTGGYLGAENQLLRVAIASVENGVPTIVWGFDDASFLYRVTSASYEPESGNTTLTLASAPVDSYHQPVENQIVELLRDAVQLAPEDSIAASSGFIAELAAKYEPTARTLVLKGQPPAGYLEGATSQLYLRVWQGTVAAPAGMAVTLGETGVAVTLGPSEGPFHAGDFWQFALRPIEPTIVYPARFLEAPQPPDGPRTWACPLAVISWAAGTPTTASCVAGFDSLVKLTEQVGGCCTVSLRPSDVEEGATLGALLAGYAGKGPTTICLEPGTYTLSEPLVLGGEYDGLTLKACREGVVLAAPSTPGPEFLLGLIVIEEAASVTLDGLELQMPLVDFSPAPGAFSGLASQNVALLDAYANSLTVAIGVSAQEASDLTISQCSFTFPAPGQTSVFAAGIYASGEARGLSLTGCSFSLTPAPTTVPFADLAQSASTEPPYQLTFGYVHLPTTAPAASATTTAVARAISIKDPGLPIKDPGLPIKDPGLPITEPAAPSGAGSAEAAVGAATGDQTASAPGLALPVLHDAVIERCVFEGLTVPVVALARLGTIRVDRNTIRDCYGGIWLVTFQDTGAVTLFDQIGGGESSLWTDFNRAGTTALLDRIYVLALAMGQVLPTTPPTAASVPSRVIFNPGALQFKSAETLLGNIFSTVEAASTSSAAATSTSEAGTPGSSAAGAEITRDVASRIDIGQTGLVGADKFAIAQKFPAVGNILEHLGTAAQGTRVVSIPVGETGEAVLLRLTITDNQIDAVVEDSYSGAGIVVLDLTSNPGSLLLHGNRIRNRFPQGQTALVVQVAEAAVSASIVANEVPAPTATSTESQPLTPTSLVLQPTNLLAVPAVAITGNVLVSSPKLPGRTGIAAPLNVWEVLNTVVAYSTPTTSGAAAAGETGAS
jgi:hypothetical protein